MKIALVHDFLREYGGAERVVEAIHEIWPDAPLYTSFVDWKALGRHAERFRGWDIRTSWVQKNWLVKKFHSPLRFLAPRIWENIDLSGYDVVLTSSGWFMSRAVAMNRVSSIVDCSSCLNYKIINHELQTKNQVHICYIHHPPRNLYGYATGSNLQKYPLVRIYTAIVNFFLRHYDFQTAQSVDYFIANSKETARRVKKFYRRESTVIYPPITISNYPISNPPSANWRRRTNTPIKNKNEQNKYYLSVGRLSWAKRADLAIEACNKLKEQLVIVGSGKEEQYLRSIAGPTITFAGSVSDEELARFYEGAKALIFTALEEDFGMVLAEAMAHGVPVIALAQGGVTETVIDGKTGILFYEPTVVSLLSAIKQFNNITISPAACITQAKKFSKVRFQKEIKHFVQSHI